MKFVELNPPCKSQAFWQSLAPSRREDRGHREGAGPAPAFHV